MNMTKLKSIFLAAAIAVTSVSAYTPPVSAASVTVTTDGRVIYRDRDRHHHRKRGWHKRHHHRDCYVKKTKYRHHGRVIVKKVRVCR